jgi:adenylate kinase
MDLLLIGAQGSGKGTQADKLSQALGIPHVASGDLFRKAFDEKTEYRNTSQSLHGSWGIGS